MIRCMVGLRAVSSSDTCFLVDGMLAIMLSSWLTQWEVLEGKLCCLKKPSEIDDITCDWGCDCRGRVLPFTHAHARTHAWMGNHAGYLLTWTLLKFAFCKVVSEWMGNHAPNPGIFRLELFSNLRSVRLWFWNKRLLLLASTYFNEIPGTLENSFLMGNFHACVFRMETRDQTRCADVLPDDLPDHRFAATSWTQFLH